MVRLDSDLLVIFFAKITGTTSLPLANGNIEAFQRSSFSSAAASSPEVHLHSPTRIFFLSRDSAKKTRGRPLSSHAMLIMISYTVLR